jgi:hypothetical protein
VAKKNPPSSVKTGTPFVLPPPPRTPEAPPASPGGRWQDTQFKRAVARSYRNAITKQVSDDLHDVILGWLTSAERQKPHLALHLDQSNYKKWVSEGTLHLRVLTQILVQRAKDFTDLRLPNEVLIVGHRRAEDLKIGGALAALNEGYRRLVGDDGRLTDDEAFILLLLYRYTAERERDLTALAYTWVLKPSSASKQEQGNADWIRARLGSRASEKLAALVNTWSEVCVAVCKVLEEHAGLAGADDS